MDNGKGKKSVRPPIPKIVNPSQLPTSEGAPSSSSRNNNMPAASPASPTASELELIVNRSKKAASYLRLLTHCRYCQGSCQEKECVETFRLMKHVALCGNQTQCMIQGCQTTKRLLQHAAECSARSKSLPEGQKNACLVCTLAASSELCLPFSTSPSVSSNVTPRTSMSSNRDESDRNNHDGDDEWPIKTHIPSFCQPRSVSPTPLSLDESPSTALKRRLSESLNSGNNIDASAVQSSSQHAQSATVNEVTHTMISTALIEQPVIKSPRLGSAEGDATVFSLSLGRNSVSTSSDGLCVNP